MYRFFAGADGLPKVDWKVTYKNSGIVEARARRRRARYDADDHAPAATSRSPTTWTRWTSWSTAGKELQEGPEAPGV